MSGVYEDGIVTFESSSALLYPYVVEQGGSGIGLDFTVLVVRVSVSGDRAWIRCLRQTVVVVVDVGGSVRTTDLR